MLEDLALITRASDDDAQAASQLYNRIVSNSPRLSSSSRGSPVVLDYAAFTHWAMPLDEGLYVVHRLLTISGCLTSRECAHPSRRKAKQRVQAALLATAKKGGGQTDFARAFNNLDKNGDGYASGAFGAVM